LPIAMVLERGSTPALNSRRKEVYYFSGMAWKQCVTGEEDRKRRRGVSSTASPRIVDDMGGKAEGASPTSEEQWREE